MASDVARHLPKGAIVSTAGKIIRNDEIGQFWGNNHNGRTDAFKPIDLAWSRLERFFGGCDEALIEWQGNRFVPGVMDREMTLEDERALSVARQLCRIQPRILGLFNTVVTSETQTLPRSAMIIEGLLEFAPQPRPTKDSLEDTQSSTTDANHKATAVLADIWSIAGARSDLGVFTQNFAALTFCFQLLSTRGLDGLQIQNKLTRTPRMYTALCLLSTPLTALLDRNFLATTKNLTWKDLTMLAGWYHRVALLELPPAVLEIERKIMHALRDAISVGYRAVDSPFFETQKIILRLLTDASELVKPLSRTMFENAEQTIPSMPRTSKAKKRSRSSSSDVLEINRDSKKVKIEDGEEMEVDRERPHAAAVAASSLVTSASASGPDLRPHTAPTTLIAKRLIDTEGDTPTRPSKPLIDLISTGDVSERRPAADPDAKLDSHQDEPASQTYIQVAARTMAAAAKAVSDGKQGNEGARGQHDEEAQKRDTTDVKGDEYPVQDEEDVGGDGNEEYASGEDNEEDEGGDGNEDEDEEDVEESTSHKSQDNTTASATPSFPARSSTRIKALTNKPEYICGNGVLKPKKKQGRHGRSDGERVSDDTPLARETYRRINKPLNLQFPEAVMVDLGAEAVRRSDILLTDEQDTSSSDSDFEAGNSSGSDRSDGSALKFELLEEKEDVTDIVQDFEPVGDAIGITNDPAWTHGRIATSLHRNRSSPLSDDLWTRRRAGMDVDAFPESAETYRTRVFGQKAITEMTELMAARTPQWMSESDPPRIREVTGNDREHAVSSMLHQQSHVITVIRKNAADKTLDHSEALKDMAGSMPMECQVPGFVHHDTAIEYSIDEGLFTLDAKQMLSCARDTTKNGVNFLGGTWTEDTYWASLVRSQTVNFREDWQQTRRSVDGMDDTFPAEHINFWTCGNPGSYSPRHVTANGFGTVATLSTGLRVWYVFLPKWEHRDIFYRETIDPKDIPIHYWRVYGIVLRAGDTIIMPPGVLHAVLTIEASLMRGGHFLSPYTLRRTVLVNLMLKEHRLATSNFGHSDTLIALVVRHVNRLMQLWDWETRLMNSRLPVKHTSGEDWPVWPPKFGSSAKGFAADWLAILFLLPIITTSSQDNAPNRLNNINHIYTLTAEKAMQFVEFWSKRTRSSKFREEVEKSAIKMMTTSDGQRWHKIPFPMCWRPAADDTLSSEGE